MFLLFFTALAIALCSCRTAQERDLTRVTLTQLGYTNDSTWRTTYHIPMVVVHRWQLDSSVMPVSDYVVLEDGRVLLCSAAQPHLSIIDQSGSETNLVISSETGISCIAINEGRILLAGVEGLHRTNFDGTVKSSTVWSELSQNASLTQSRYPLYNSFVALDTGYALHSELDSSLLFLDSQLRFKEVISFPVQTVGVPVFVSERVYSISISYPDSRGWLNEVNTSERSSESRGMFNLTSGYPLLMGYNESIVIADGHILFLLDEAGKIVWGYEFEHEIYQMALDHDDNIVTSNKTGLFILDPTGTLISNVELGFTPTGHFLVDGENAVLIASENGIFRVSDGRMHLLSEFKLGGQMRGVYGLGLLNERIIVIRKTGQVDSFDAG